MKNVLILFGGVSCEHDISIVSTFQVVKSFDEYLYNVMLVYIDKKGVWKLVGNKTTIEEFLKKRDKLKVAQLCVNENVLYVKQGKKYKPYFNIDIVFPILHGVNGEDGSIANLLNVSNVPFVGCNAVASAIGMDKSLFKEMCKSLPLLSYKTIIQDDLINEKYVEALCENIDFPCIIKPSRLGSSIGINICENKENFINLLNKSLKFDKKVIVEPYISDMREFNIALYKTNNEIVVSEIEEPILNNKMLSFEDKYLTFSGQFQSKNIPAKIGTKLKQLIIDNARKTYNLLNCSGVIRVDFIYDKAVKRLYVNEINTIPGALGLYLFEANGMDKKQVIDQLIRETLRQYNYSKDIETNYQTNVLDKQDFSKFNNK